MSANKWLFVISIVGIVHELISHHNKFILTGGPCCGKTSVIRELKKRGYQTCPEAYEELYKEAKTHGILDQFLAHTINQRMMLLERHALQESRLDISKPSFLDRSIPDVIFYGNYLKLVLPNDLMQKFAEHKSDYVFVFFFEPLPKELYYQTDIRYESRDEARAIHQTLLNGYIQHGFTVIHVPFDSVENRANFIIRAVQATQ